MLTTPDLHRLISTATDQLRELMASGNPQLIQAMQRGLAQLVGRSSGYVESLPQPIRTRVEFLSELQEKYEDLEEEYKAELRKLEEKYRGLYQPLFDQRRKVITGEMEVPENETEEGKKVVEELEKENNSALDKGIPDFWLTALRSHPELEQMINDKDAEVLSFVTDIACEDIIDEDNEDAGFRVTFHFKQNPFFKNSTLTASFALTEEQGYVQVRGIEGCDVQWYPDKNVTVKKMKKKPKPGSRNKGPNTKVEPIDSFFRWFTDAPEVPEHPAVGGDDDEDDELEALRDAVEQHMHVGELIKEEIVPNAIKWFTGEALMEMEEGDEFDEGDLDLYDDEDEEGDDDGEEEEDDEEDEDDDDDDDDEDEPAIPPTDSKEQPAECKQQ